MVTAAVGDTHGLFTYTDNDTFITITDYPDTATGTVDIPSTIADKPVTNIASNAFSNCTGITSVAIPAGVTSISLGGTSSAFTGCSGLTLITVDQENANYSSLDGLLFNKDLTVLYRCPAGKSGTYGVPTGVASISSYAFSNCTVLTSVTIPDSVTSISSYAFSNCTGLTSVAIPDSVTSIGTYVFANCSGLTSVAIPASVTSIGTYAFSNCVSLASVSIPGSVTSIGAYAFSNCTGLPSVTIPGSVTSLVTNAFSNCTGLTSVVISAGVTTIGTSVFPNCTSLTSVSIPASVTSIGVGLSFSFAGCPALTSIIVDEANPNFSSLDGILFNKAQTTLHQCAGGKSGAYTVPSGVTTIGANAFSNCAGLTSVSIPASVTTINNSFSRCSGLVSITVDDANPNISSLDGILFNKTRTMLVQCPGGRSGAYAVPAGVGTIGASAFAYCAGLTSVTLPSGLFAIYSSAFASSGITGVTLPGSISLYSGGAFANCKSLEYAAFLGQAPTTPMFSSMSAEFTVYYSGSSLGFTTPLWQGYPTYPGQSPQFTSAPPPANGQVGLPFSHTCAATAAPLATFAVTSGALPDGLSLSNTGVISGTPTTPGTFTGTITAANAFPATAAQPFSIEVRNPWLFTSGGTQGTVTGGGSHSFNTTAILTAAAHPGYVFASWSGDASGTANPLSVLVNGDKTITAVFAPDSRDGDDDGLTNYQEIVEYGTDPTKQDTDGDGAKDAVDGSPLDPTETLDTDHDRIGDNVDPDDDNDGYSDTDELTIHQTDPKRADSDGDGLNDPAEIETHHTNPNLADTDNDGLSDGAEFTTHHTNPLLGDTDGDGFLDGYEVQTGKSPLDLADHPALVAEARTAIEFTFPSGLGATYHIEASADLATWEIVESGITGTGGLIQRFYSTRNQPKRYFRVMEN